MALFASAGFVALFGFFLYGSFIGQTEMRVYDDMDNQADLIKRNEGVGSCSFRLMTSLATEKNRRREGESCFRGHFGLRQGSRVPRD